jgi:hypothetical protein
MAVSGGESDGRDRWIGNFGLGHRFFPNATEDDSGDWMVGYNAFLDHDFTRTHNRGGVGVELQYDWLRLSSNAYFPLSGWKNSYDFDRRLVEERPARGWDARVKAFLPTNRHFAFTGGFTQWYGDHVGMFGYRNLEKDPKVWDYGLEYTPFSLLTASVTQQRTERGQTETRFGLSFTYHFDQPLAKQLKPSKNTGTVSGDRYEFVDRENLMPLAYRATAGAYRIEYAGRGDPNKYLFRLRNGFDEIAAGVAVTIVGGSNEVILSPSGTNIHNDTSDGDGRFGVIVISSPNPSFTLTVRAGNSEETFTFGGVTSLKHGLKVKFDKATGEDFVTGGPQGYQSMVTMTVEKYENGDPVQNWSPSSVVWNVTSNINSSLLSPPAPQAPVWKRDADELNGLAWTDQNGLPNGYTGTWTNNEIVTLSAPTDQTTVYLADVVGSRTVKVNVTVDGKPVDEASFTFGAGPLSEFSGTGTSSQQWARYHAQGDFINLDGTGTTEQSRLDFPVAVGVCDGVVDNAVTYKEHNSATSSGFNPDSGNEDYWSAEHIPPGSASMTRYAKGANLPTVEKLLTVSVGSAIAPNSRGAALAAGWSNYAWSGEVQHDGMYGSHYVALYVNLGSGTVVRGGVEEKNTGMVAVCLSP